MVPLGSKCFDLTDCSVTAFEYWIVKLHDDPLVPKGLDFTDCSVTAFEYWIV